MTEELLTKVEGVLASLCVPYSDATCKTIDELAYREHAKRTLDLDISAVVCCGHTGELLSLDRAERVRLLEIVQEEVRGRVPVIQGVFGDSTQELIRQGEDAKHGGADAVFINPPTLIGWDRRTAGDFLLHHYLRFDEIVNMPMILYGGGTETSSGTYSVLPETFRQIVARIDNIVGIKIVSQGDLSSFRTMVKHVKSVRDIGCLHAGSSHLFATCLYGGDGILSGGSNFMAREEIDIISLVKKGELSAAWEIAQRIEPLADVIYGPRVGLSLTYFHYRYKVAAWLAGNIPLPHMRLPQIPIPKKEVEMLSEAMIAAGIDVVRDPEEISISEI